VTARKHKPMSEGMLDAVASRFRALAEPGRLRILQHLMKGECSVSELTEATGLSQASTSKHLAILHGGGLVERRREGTTVYHAIADPVVHELCALMCAHIVRHVRTGARAIDVR